jgi:uncharacterized protein (TIGR02265 family)
MASSPSEVGSQRDGSVFEGLFVRALKPTGRFAEELKAAGYDPKAPRVRYPVKVWNDALAVAARHLFPGMTLPQAHWKLGRKFVDGFLGTLVGGVVGVALPLIGPARFAARVPSYMKMDANKATCVAVEVAKNQWRIEFRNDASVDPEFIAGAAERGLERTNVAPRVIVCPVAGGFDLTLSW